MFGGGVSTKGVGNVMETLTGTDPSPSTVSRVFHSLLAFYSFPKEHWKTIHTNNIIKCFFEEVKRRFHKMASAFRNERNWQAGYT